MTSTVYDFFVSVVFFKSYSSLLQYWKDAMIENRCLSTTKFCFVYCWALLYWKTLCTDRWDHLTFRFEISPWNEWGIIFGLAWFAAFFKPLALQSIKLIAAKWKHNSASFSRWGGMDYAAWSHFVHKWIIGLAINFSCQETMATPAYHLNTSERLDFSPGVLDFKVNPLFPIQNNRTAVFGVTHGWGIGK